MHADWDERISSLTDKAIKEGLQNLKNGNEYDKLYFAAKARAEADFWWGSTRHKLFR